MIHQLAEDIIKREFSIPISQILFTIQGEGYLVGTPSCLIRMDSCNLRCPFCDTSYIIDTTPQYLVTNRSLHEFELMIQQYRNNFPKVTSIMLTGGEPFTNTNFIILITHIFAKIFQLKSIEIETNGTLLSKNLDLIEILDRFANENNITLMLNVSPKLDRSCYRTTGIVTQDQVNALVDEIVETTKEMRKKLSSTVINIKLLFDANNRYLGLLDRIAKTLDNQSNYNIFVMPITYTNNKSKTKENIIECIKYCIRTGFRFSPRIQLMFDECHL